MGDLLGVDQGDVLGVFVDFTVLIMSYIYPIEMILRRSCDCELFFDETPMCYDVLKLAGLNRPFEKRQIAVTLLILPSIEAVPRICL